MTMTVGTRDERAIDDRELFAVQALEIGRLSGHVVPLTPGGFIPVSGEGDRHDSNGSGKTTFLAIVALLLGDPQWRAGNAAGNELVNLLFDPELAGAGGRGLAIASHGYVIGAFAGDSDREARSVWMRINREKRQHLGPLQVRVYGGTHLALADSDTARLTVADDWWESADAAAEFGLRDYGPGLFGSRPRVSAYVRTRGGRGSDMSLLSAEVDQFDEVAIGAELLRLCGQEELLRHDAEQRRDRAAKYKDLKESDATDRIERGREDGELRELDGLDAARKALRSAERNWTDHFAKQLVDGEASIAATEEQIQTQRQTVATAVTAFDIAHEVVDELPDATRVSRELDRQKGEHEEAQRRVSDAERKHERLGRGLDEVVRGLREARLRSSGWAGPTPEQLREPVEAAEAEHLAWTRAHDHADALAGVAQREFEEAQRMGRPEPAKAVAVLHAAGVTSAVGLLDGLSIGDDIRPLLEPALVPWRDAVAVDAADRDAAVAALAGLPGTVLVSGEGAPELPAVVEAPAGSHRFVAHLIDVASHGERPAESGWVSSGWGEVGVIAPLPRRITGRDAAIDAARDAADAAVAALGQAAESLRAARAARDALLRELERSSAAAEAQLLEASLAELQDQHGSAGRDAEAERLARGGLLTEIFATQERLAGLAAERRLADEALSAARIVRKEAEKDLGLLVQAADERRRALRRNPFAERPGDAHERAAAAARDESTLRAAANDDLATALTSLGIDLATGAGADRHDTAIAVVARRRRAVAQEGRESQISFDELAAPLINYLGARAERDAEQRERIQRARRDREAQIDGYSTTLAHLDSELDSLGESIESAVLAQIKAVELRFDQLDRINSGHGAELEVKVFRASDETDWKVWVQPRWARGAGERPTSYRRPGNTAMKKQRTINLVLAALLDDQRAHRGGVLILDELGDSLGQQHRLSVLSAIAKAAAESGITVLATCQDTMLDAAGQFARLVVYFRFTGGTEVVNRAPALYGYELDGARVRRSVEAVLAGRPLA